MRVYLIADDPKPHHDVFVTPGRNSDSSDFRDAQGTPIQFCVHFDFGMAEVPDNLGRWMIDNGRARASRIILPAQRIFRSIVGGAQ